METALPGPAWAVICRARMFPLLRRAMPRTSPLPMVPPEDEAGLGAALLTWAKTAEPGWPSSTSWPAVSVTMPAGATIWPPLLTSSPTRWTASAALIVPWLSTAPPVAAKWLTPALKSRSERLAGGGVELADVDDRPRAEGDAGGVDEVDDAVGAERAVEARGDGRLDAVEHAAPGARLDERDG